MTRTLDRRTLLKTAGAALLAAAALPGRSARSAPLVTVFKDPGCGCCGAWVEHLAAAGFRTVVHETAGMASVKLEAGVPADLASCHTAHVDGYVIEGHVPAADIRRLLRERPPVVGLSVPGMPIGSPGMEVPGTPAEPFDSVAFDGQGGRSVFGRHRS